MCPAYNQLLKREVEKMGSECIIMKDGDEILVYGNTEIRNEIRGLGFQCIFK